MRLTGYLCLVLVGLTFGIATADIPAAIKNDINNGINAANAISTYIHDRNFTLTLTKITSLISPFLGALGPIVSLILGLFGSGPSAELQYMQKMMKHIDLRFDAVDNKLAEIGRKIDHVHTQAIFGPIENNIHIVFGKLSEFYQAGQSTVGDAKTEFIDTFKAKGVGNAQNIYDGLMITSNIFSENLGDATMKYTENNRAETQRFMLGLLNLLFNAVKSEISYYKAVGRSDSYVKDQKDKWVRQIGLFKNKMAEIDRKVTAKWSEQADADVEHYAGSESSRNNQDLANFLYNFLKHKYYWRDWLVMVYDDITGSQIHFMHACGGWMKFRNHGHNIVISSVESNDHASSSQQRSSSLNVKTRNKHEHHSRGVTYYTYSDIKADAVYNSFPPTIRDHCTPYAYLGVIQRSSNLQHYPATSNRLTVKSSTPYYLVAFG